MSLYRSEPMQLVQIFLHSDAVYATVEELGSLGIIQFRDLNVGVSPFHRNFVKQVRRADEMQRKLRFLQDQIRNYEQEREKITISPLHETDFGINIDALEGELEEREREVIELLANETRIRSTFQEVVETLEVLEKEKELFGDSLPTGAPGEISIPTDGTELEIFHQEQPRDTSLHFFAGILARDRLMNFQKVLWRATRGNMLFKQASVELDKEIQLPTQEVKPLAMFSVFVQGATLQTKVKRICDSFGARLYPCPQSSRERDQLIQSQQEKFTDLKQVMDSTRGQVNNTLSGIAARLPSWETQVKKEKAIYHMMNQFNYDLGRQTLWAEGWCPVSRLNDLKAAIDRGSAKSSVSVPSFFNVIETKDSPPTYFITTKFTSAFHSIIEAYGVCHYQEINPAIFSVMTFPFLFGVMFGDVGHGILMSIFAAVLIWKEEQLSRQTLNEMVDMCFSGRYLILLMGLFSIYAGFLYNECFSISMDIFGTNWAWENENVTDAYEINPDYVYPFGVDPSWKGSENELSFYNSLKMKMSVIFGVSQMVLGILVSGMNAKFFKKKINIYFEFLPQLVFMMSLFGYLCVIIVIKWLTDFSDSDAPNLLTTMIDMVMSPGSVEIELYSGQGGIQTILVLVAFISVPLMLFPKPFLLRREYESLGATAGDDSHGGEEFDFSEVMVHQCIHTIEFVLGAISNTASYLRLWALSLAHAQLSTVFWEMIMVMALEQSGFIPPFAGFAIWATLTVCVLMIMESLSAFLHALRLHWVEFMNKFYLGDGVKFIPFDFKTLSSTEEEM